MPTLETKHKRKSAILTTIILLLLLFVIFNYGMQYLDPPEEYGIAINFGDAEEGSGEPVSFTKKVATPEVVEKEEVVEEVKEVPKEIIKEEIITEETIEDVPVVEKAEVVKKEPVKEVVKKEIPKEKPKPKPSKETTDALNSLLNGNASDGAPKGEGDDEIEGVKGREDGDPNSTKDNGNNNFDGGKFKLKREAEKLELPINDCQEEGTVFVEIEVNSKGKVTNAEPGIKGSTSTNPCLLKVAKEAALNTIYSADNNAFAIQKGTIIYKFAFGKKLEIVDTLFQ